MKATWLHCAIALLLVAPQAGSAGTLHVPLEYPTIQSGIDWATHGDTVLVDAGTYAGPDNTGIRLWGKEISLVSRKGPAHTTIDCEDSGRAFTLTNGETRDSVIEGFTVLNGHVYGVAGAAYLRDSQPVFRFCVFAHCYVGPSSYDGAAFGGAVYSSDGAHPLFENCSFLGNEVHGYPGMGTDVAIGGGAVTLLNCLQGYGFDNGHLHGTWFGLDGGAIDVTVERCMFVHPDAGRLQVPDAGLCDWYPGGQTGFELCSDSPALPENNDWGELVGALGAGCGPCVTAVESLSWGSIKALFR